MKIINDLLVSLCAYGIIIMMPVMVTVIFIQVIMRYIFHWPFIWAEEFARYMLVWISSLGSAYGARKMMHIKMSFIENKLGNNAKSFVNFIVKLIILFFFIICFKEGLTLSLSQMDQISPAMRISISVPLAAIPTCFGLLIMFALEFITKEIKEILRKLHIFKFK